MLSIVVCSICPERLEVLKQNISRTIGVAHEFIVIDNREQKWPIAKAYNYGAQKAVYPYLFFVHEDVLFHSQNWGEVIEKQLCEPDCGVIGFAGSKYKLKSYTGWGQREEYTVTHLYQRIGNKTRYDVWHVFRESPFEEVVVLDGLGLFVRKDVWSAYPYDESALTGFHCYDLDFSLQIAAGGRYKNYVCCSNQVLVEHLSLGSYTAAWYSDTIRLHREKWHKILPMRVAGCTLSKKKERWLEERYFNVFLRKLMMTDCAERAAILCEFLRLPFSWKHFGHCFTAVKNFFFPSRKEPRSNVPV